MLMNVAQGVAVDLSTSAGGNRSCPLRYPGGGLGQALAAAGMGRDWRPKAPVVPAAAGRRDEFGAGVDGRDAGGRGCRRHGPQPDSYSRSGQRCAVDRLDGHPVRGGRQHRRAASGQWGRGAVAGSRGYLGYTFVPVWGLVPLMLGVVTAEQLLRLGIGMFKPLATARTPPGALSWRLLPVAAATLAMSLTEASSPRTARGPSPSPVRCHRSTASPESAAG